MRTGLKWLSVVTAAGMGLVLLMGALVTKTGSGDGCGKDWPLCNGKFVPAYTVESMIEYSHRAVSGAVGLLVVAAAVAAWLKLRHNKEALLYIGIGFGFTVVQSILGAMAVIWPQSDAVMALHFGFSLIAFAGTLLFAIGVCNGRFAPEEDRPRDIARRRPPHSSRISAGFRNLVWGTTIYSYAVVYLGAFVRHTDSMGGCAGWPLCNGQWIPELSGATGIVFLHRTAALLLLVLVAVLAVIAQRRYGDIPPLRNGSLWAAGLTILQILCGAAIVFSMGTDWYLLAALAHVVVVSGLFGVLCELSATAYRHGVGAEQGHSVPVGAGWVGKGRT